VGFGAFFAALAGPIAKRVLIACGFGVVSYAGISTALNHALDASKSAFAGLTGDSLALVQIAGVPTVLGIISGALVARVAVMSLKKLELLA